MHPLIQRTVSAAARRPLSVTQKVSTLLTISGLIAIAGHAIGWLNPGQVLLVVLNGAYWLIHETHWSRRFAQLAQTLRDTYWATKDNTRDVGRLTDASAHQGRVIQRFLRAEPEIDRTGPQATTLN